MSIRLSPEDFGRAAGILSTMPEFQTAQNRVDLVTDVFAGTPRKDDVVSSLNLDGAPRAVAVRVVERLQTFGQDEPGRETLGVLVNKLLSYLGGGDDAEFLRGLLRRYPFHTKPTADLGAPDHWLGREPPGDLREKIIGENTLREIFMLELALDAARAVVRLDTPTSYGTGFMITRDLLMTNNHVLADSPAAERTGYEFNYQVDRHNRPAEVRTCGAEPGGLFYTNPELDFTVIELRDPPAGLTPLVLKPERTKRGDRVNIIQHPGGHYKKISFQNNFVAYADARVIQYTTPTQPGSSGSPVCTNDFEVIGIHHRGGLLKEPGTWRHHLRNEGTSSIAILDDLGKNAPHVVARLTG
ncbi:trypsin-like peptidase domain-containing protein [Nonomuraea zeae]|uniref:Serine protease n=1 Tax=Nonomuraea zeae TaxID=1642303 RepID=A0A5S4FNR9_9ACTN|nr:trypsin-like peptidase domain-containing protein [Nonomuraea zeae]TMR22325.1 trypsin-like peptidase domain-containing protein [Nonomuraea zeae]